MNIMIGCPVRNRDWILPKYLKCIYEIDYPKEKIIPCFIVNDSTDNSEKILNDFMIEHGHEYKDFIIYIKNLGQVEDKRQYEIRQKIYHSLAKLRNRLLNCAIDKNVDYLLSVDSDILVPPHILKNLLADDKDIVAAQIWNDSGQKYPNIMIEKNGKFVHYFDFPKQSLFKCDVTGAVYLIKKKVLNSIRYEYHKQGEDVGFCLSARNKGFEIWVDSRVQCKHIMNKI